LRRQDTKKEQAGVWVVFEGVRVKVARLHNPKAQAMIEQHFADNAARRAAGDPPREYKEFRLDLLSQAILVGWEGLDGDDGKPLPYTSSAARAILADPAYSDFRDFVETEAGRRENFVEAGEKALEKNSSALSPQNSLSPETSAAH
jgi:hypothetical protein